MGNMDKTTSRCYQARLQPTPHQADLLIKTFDVYSRGTEEALDIVLNLAASVRPGDDIIGKVKPPKPQKPPKSKKTQEEVPPLPPKSPFIWTPAHVCFANWFALESSAPLSLPVLDPSSIPALFRKRWQSLTNQEIPETLLVHLEYLGDDSMRTGSMWVDRFKAGNSFRDRFHIPREEATRLVAYITCKSDAPAKARNLCSNLWGDDNRKSNSEAILAFYTKAIKVVTSHNPDCSFRDLALALPKPPKLSGPHAYIWMLANLPDEIKENDLHPDQARAILQSHGLLKGNYEKTCESENLRSPVGSEFIEKQIKILNGKTVHTARRSALKLSPGWRQELLDHLCNVVGIPYQDGKNRRLNEFTQFFAEAWSAIDSWKTNSLNQCSNRYDAKLRYDKAIKVPVNKEVAQSVANYKERILANWRSSPSYSPNIKVPTCYLRKYQFKRLDDVLTYCKELAKSPREAIAEMQAATIDTGDVNLLDHLANTLSPTAFRQCEKHLKTIADADDATKKVNTLLYPTLCHFGPNRTAYPWFGDPDKSKPTGMVLPYQTNNYGTNLFRVSVNVFEGDKIVPIEIWAASKRFVKEILKREEDAIPAPRNHYHYSAFKGNVRSDVDISKITIQPYKAEDSDRFYMRLSVPFNKLNPPAQKLLAVQPNLTILSVDRGMRNAAAYTVLQRSDHGVIAANLNPKTKDEKHSILLEVTRHGMIKDSVEFEGNGELYDRLDSKCDRPITSAELEFFRSLVPPSQLRQEPSNYSYFQLRLARYCKSQLHAVGLDAVPLVKKVYDFVRQQRASRNHKGGMLMSRIDALDSFQYVYSQMIRLYQDQGQSAPAWVTNSHEFLARGRVARRRERARVTASKIIELAIDSGAHVIAIEKLSLVASENNPRGSNRRLSQWLHKSITKMIKEGCELHGIAVYEVNPQYTSLVDCTSGDLGCRFTAIPQNVANLERTIRDSFIGIKGGQFEKFRREWLCDVARKCRIDPNAHHANELAVRIVNQKMWVPAYKGEYFRVKFHGQLPKNMVVHANYIDADLNAAVNIGVLGARYVLDFCKKENNEPLDTNG